jgi:hypothetical protein
MVRLFIVPKNPAFLWTAPPHVSRALCLQKLPLMMHQLIIEAVWVEGNKSIWLWAITICTVPNKYTKLLGSSALEPLFSGPCGSMFRVVRVCAGVQLKLRSLALP